MLPRDVEHDPVGFDGVRREVNMRACALRLFFELVEIGVEIIMNPRFGRLQRRAQTFELDLFEAGVTVHSPASLIAGDISSEAFVVQGCLVPLGKATGLMAMPTSRMFFQRFSGCFDCQPSPPTPLPS